MKKIIEQLKKKGEYIVKANENAIVIYEKLIKNRELLDFFNKYYTYNNPNFGRVIKGYNFYISYDGAGAEHDILRQTSIIGNHFGYDYSPAYCIDHGYSYGGNIRDLLWNT